MTIRESAENYLETILILKNRNGEVRSVDIASELGFSKPSVSIAMKKLRKDGYISVDGNGYITLETSGREIAERMYERHTFFLGWFMELGIDPKTATEDACRIEHVISAETFDALKKQVKCAKTG